MVSEFMRGLGMVCYLLMLFSIVWIIVFLTVTGVQQIWKVYRWLDRKIDERRKRADDNPYLDL